MWVVATWQEIQTAECDFVADLASRLGEMLAQQHIQTYELMRQRHEEESRLGCWSVGLKNGNLGTAACHQSPLLQEKSRERWIAEYGYAQVLWQYADEWVSECMSE